MAAAPCRGAVPSTSSPRFHHARHPRPLSCKGTRLVRDSKVAVVPLPNRPRGFGGRCGSDSRCTIQTCRAALGDTGYQKSLGYSPISIAVTAVALVVSGVANRVAHKVASVAFAEYILVLSLFLVVSYIMAYFSALFVRLKRGIVTKRMLEYPKWKFGAIGLMDAFGLVMQLAAAVHLPGAIIPVLAQINIPFSLLVSRVLLGRRFQGRQLLGSGLVIGGVLLSLRPYAMDTILSGPSMVANAALYASSYIFAAISAVGKESILHNRDYGEDGMDVFVINSFGSLAQGAAIFLMLALASVIHGNLPGTGGHPLSYLREGFRCFQDNPSLVSSAEACDAKPIRTRRVKQPTLLFSLSLSLYRADATPPPFPLLSAPGVHHVQHYVQPQCRAAGEEVKRGADHPVNHLRGALDLRCLFLPHTHAAARDLLPGRSQGAVSAHGGDLALQYKP